VIEHDSSADSPGRLTSLDLERTELSPILRDRLRSVADLVLAADDLDDLLDMVTGRIADGFGIDVVTVLLLEPEAEELVVRASHGLEVEVEAGVRVPLGKGLAGTVAASIQPRMVNDLSEVQVWSPLLGEAIRSVISVPLVAGDHVIGVLNVGSTGPHAFTNDDLLIAELFGVRVAHAIERVAARTSERLVRSSLEHGMRRFEQFQTLLEELSGASTETEVLEIIESRAASITDADRVVLSVVRDGQLVHLSPALAADDGSPVPSDVLVALSASDRPTLAKGDVVVVGRAELAERFPGLDAQPADEIAWITIPMLSNSGVIGAIGLGHRKPVVEDPGLYSLLRSVGRQIGTALERACSFDDERELADRLRELLRLSSTEPIAGLDLAVRYVPTHEIGGDWHAIHPAPDGSAVFVVGDIVGHGLSAAAGVAQLRVAFRALVNAGSSPSELLARLAALLDEVPPDSRFVTALCGAVAADRRSVRLASAGHPPPLLLRDGIASVVDLCPSPPLTESIELGSPATSIHELAAGDRLVCFTDGVIGSDSILEEVIATVTHASTSPSRASLEKLAESVISHADGSDDATVFVLEVLT
jgi:GAF domain-containing protein